MQTAIIQLQDGRAIKVALDAECAPISVENFVSLAKDGFYKGLIFHRVIKGFMIQGGGMNVDMMSKKAPKTIKGEFLANGVNNQRKHLKGTLSMARTNVNDSASSQFFICSADTSFLDGSYAAFGQVDDEQSMQIVDDISCCMTESRGYHDDVPVEPIIIKDVTIIE